MKKGGAILAITQATKIGVFILISRKVGSKSRKDPSLDGVSGSIPSSPTSTSTLHD